MILRSGSLEDGRTYSVLEEVEISCLLGLRFWDAVRDRQIREGLRVRAWPLATGRPVVEAFRTRSSVYAFQGLPGMAFAERLDDDVEMSPPSRDFVVEVTDPQQRYLPAAFEVTLPLPERGVFLAQPPGSPPSSPVVAPPGLYLFSTPTRRVGPEVATVRGELRVADTGEPAAHALVSVSLPSGTTVYAIADDGGRFAALFPYPPLTESLSPIWSSPPVVVSPPVTPIPDRTWDISVRVAYQPGRLAALPGSTEPEYREVLQQSAAQVLLDTGSPPTSAAAFSAVLGYGGEVVARTDGAAELWIVPEGSSP